MNKDIEEKNDNIIKIYNDKAKELILSDDFVIEYRKSLQEKEEKLKNLKYNTSFFQKLIHPIRLIKTNINIKKIEQIKTEFSELIEKPITECIFDETGDITTDLDNAMNYGKPYIVRHYMGTNPIEEITLTKKLKK